MMKRIQLSKSDVKKFNQEIEKNYCVSEFFSKKDKLERVVFDDYEVISKDGNYLFFFVEDRLVPTLKLLQGQNMLKKVTVDMGAVPFVIKGADIMRPGITVWENGILKDMIVSIIDEKNGKALGIGKMLVSGEELSNVDKGKVIKSIHFVGDALWNL
jgi:PUA-domain protein